MKTGRPKKAAKDRRTNMLRVMLTESERAAVDRAAKAAKSDTSGFVRGILLEWVEKSGHGAPTPPKKA